MYGEGAPLSRASVEVGFLDVEIARTDGLRAQSVEQSNFSAGRYTYCTHKHAYYTVYSCHPCVIRRHGLNQPASRLHSDYGRNYRHRQMHTTVLQCSDAVDWEIERTSDL